MTGPFAIFVRPCGSGWQVMALYSRIGQPWKIARRSQWYRHRPDAVEGARVEAGRMRA